MWDTFTGYKDMHLIKTSNFSNCFLIGLNVLHSLNVHHIIAYLGLCFVMGNAIALMGKMNNRIVKRGLVQTSLVNRTVKKKLYN